MATAAEPGEVWRALTDPATIKEYMFGAEVTSDWQVGSPIVFKGEWEGKQFEDKGTILAFEPEKLLEYTHFSPMSGKEDAPENYHNVSYKLEASGSGTRVMVLQDGNDDESSREHAEKTWSAMLDKLKQTLELPQTTLTPRG